jgi:hypothetical protein
MNWKFDFSPDTSDMMGNWSRRVSPKMCGWSILLRFLWENLGSGRSPFWQDAMWVLGQSVTCGIPDITRRSD